MTPATIPKYKTFGGKQYGLTAGTRHGSPKDHAHADAEWVRSLGFNVRTVKIGKEYYNYGRKK
jgi:hypothetical protein